jgi:hypothetical protein
MPLAPLSYTCPYPNCKKSYCQDDILSMANNVTPDGEKENYVINMTCPSCHGLMNYPVSVTHLGLPELLSSIHLKRQKNVTSNTSEEDNYAELRITHNISSQNNS